MADKEPLKATFFAWRKRKGSLLLPASITFVVLLIAIIALSLGANFLLLGMRPLDFAQQGRAMENIQTGAMSPFAFMGVQFLVWVLMFVLAAAYEAACLRWLIHGERGGLFGLSFGADTWRVYGGYWLWFILFIVAYVILLLLVMVISLTAGIIGRSTPIVGGIVGGVGAIVALSLPIWLAVRTAPAAAASVGLRRFAFFDSWKVSQGRFWALFGSYLLLTIAYLIVIVGIWSPLLLVLAPAFSDAVHPGEANKTSEAVNSAMTSFTGSAGGLAAYLGIQIAALIAGPLFAVLGYGINARAVLAAAADGKLQGIVTPETAKTFE
ncbi:MAG TPA: hypothetical protein VG943_06350 [Caulobacterales bacterium]|nr:hypothetical protein [Caulobacterales bacterium]